MARSEGRRAFQRGGVESVSKACCPCAPLEEEDFLLFLQPPPTGTVRREPPLVQCLLQPLHKYLGWERL